MALTNLERFLAALADPRPALASLAGDARAAEILLQIFSTSQYLSEVLIRDPDLLAWLRGGAERPDRADLAAELSSTLRKTSGEAEPALVIRRFRLRETLRICYNDIVRGLPLEAITLDLSNLAEACIEAATRLARAWAEARFGVPYRGDGAACRFVVLGMGKLGGAELNYSSDIDLVFVYDEEGRTAEPRMMSSAEFFERMGTELVRLLAEHTALGAAYRVDMRLRRTARKVPWPGRRRRPWAITKPVGVPGSGRRSSSAARSREIWSWGAPSSRPSRPLFTAVT